MWWIKSLVLSNEIFWFAPSLASPPSGKPSSSKNSSARSAVEIKPFEWPYQICGSFVQCFPLLYFGLSTLWHAGCFVVVVVVVVFSLFFSPLSFCCMARSSTRFFQQTKSTWRGLPPSKLYHSSPMPPTNHIVSMHVPGHLITFWVRVDWLTCSQVNGVCLHSYLLIA